MNSLFSKKRMEETPYFSLVFTS